MPGCRGSTSTCRSTRCCGGTPVVTRARAPGAGVATGDRSRLSRHHLRLARGRGGTPRHGQEHRHLSARRHCRALGADFFIGVPAAEDGRVARLVSFLESLSSGRPLAAGVGEATGPDLDQLATLAMDVPGTRWPVDEGAGGARAVRCPTSRCGTSPGCAPRRSPPPTESPPPGGSPASTAPA